MYVQLSFILCQSRLMLDCTYERYANSTAVRTLNTWQEATVGTRRFFAFDHFGSMKTDEILGRIRYMIKALDCKWIFLDHLSILVSGLEGDDERRNIDNLMTKLRSIVEETNVALLLVSHLRRNRCRQGT